MHSASGQEDHLFPFNLGGTICAPCAGPDVQADWRELNNALNFEIPDRYLEGTIYLRPYVNYDRRVAETNYDNNRGLIRTVRFRELDKRISIAYVPIHYHPTGYTGAQDPSARIHNADWFLKHTWPVRPDYVDYYQAAIPAVLLFSPGSPPLFDSVTIDERAGVMQALKYLFSLGHRRIAFCRPVAGGRPHLRELAYRELMAQAGHPAPDSYLVPFEGMEDPLKGIAVGFENLKRFVAEA